MGFTEVLTIIFVVCKIIGVIDWSWWLVLLPEIIAVGLYILSFILGLFGVFKGSRKIKKEWKHFDDFDF